MNRSPRYTPRERLYLAIIALLLGTLFVGGLSLPSVIAKEDFQDKSLFKELKIFTDVLAIVQRDYVNETMSPDLISGAIKGMLGTLDPHSGYLEPDFYNDLQVQTKGEFGGLGIEITIKDGLLVVVSPMEGSPAAAAGIRAGDAIVKIEGKFTKEYSLVDAVKRLRGPKGTPINISIHRQGNPDLIDVTIIRDIITVKSVRSRSLDDGFGYVRINQFMETTSEDLRKTLTKLALKSPEKKIQGLILDLRNNPGGLLTQAIRVSDFFLKEGVIVYTDGRVEKQRQKFFAHEQGTEPDYPIVVLVNGGSASASEIVAGALKDHGRGLVLGTQTFGKGSVQTITPLSNGGALTLTTALYYTKSGRSIQVTGVKPDIIMEQQEEIEEEQQHSSSRKKSKKGFIVREGDLPGAIENPSGTDSGNILRKINKTPTVGPDLNKLKPESLPLNELLAQDAQLRRAYDLLKTFTIFTPEKNQLSVTQKQES